ncbi:hypoxanthine phosphoribosyltransferase [Marinilabiliaceae bacterium ANBcel2]|nr:hypoxanthine phosphoribosyltransferase [Marinilabiliaceae bacterium ANBcel2]
MKRVKIENKEFVKMISSKEISDAVSDMANKINREFSDKNPLFISVLNGAFIFSADLIRLLSFPCNISFVKLASYAGINSTEKVKELIGFNEEIKERTIIILEDIVDTGHTIESSRQKLKDMGAGEIYVATLLFKPNALKSGKRPDFVGLEIPNDFIVGYGLDYNGYGRNLPHIYKIEN